VSSWYCNLRFIAHFLDKYEHRGRKYLGLSSSIILAIEVITDSPEDTKDAMEAVIDRVWRNVRDGNGNTIERVKTEGTKETTSVEGSQIAETAKSSEGTRVPGPYEMELIQAFKED
jgi:hypothetical protein